MPLVVSPGNNVLFSFGSPSKTYKYFEPVGWSASDPNSHFHVSWCGDSETTGEVSDTNVVGSLYKTPTSWNGTLLKGDGTTVRISVLSIPNYTNNFTGYDEVIDHCLTTVGIPLTDNRRFHMSGLSGGTGRMWKYLAQISNTSPNALLFKKNVMMSSISYSSFSVVSSLITQYTPNNLSWLWHAVDDTNQPYSQDMYFMNAAKGIKKLSTPLTGGHSNTTWSECMNVRNLDVASYYDPNVSDGLRWRFLVDHLDSSPRSITTNVTAVLV